MSQAYRPLSLIDVEGVNTIYLRNLLHTLLVYMLMIFPSSQSCVLSKALDRSIKIYETTNQQNNPNCTTPRANCEEKSHSRGNFVATD